MAYARAELGVLMQIQRQRDQLVSQRNAAADVIFGVAQAVTSSAQITSLLGDVQDKVTEVQVSEVFEDIVKSAGSLEGFRVTLTRNYTDVVTETVNKSQALVSGFQSVIDRTRAFIDNLVELRKLGLDPFLFQQLVDAGAEAGGATAKALVEGGIETVNEVNALQAELESLGVQLGEETYEVTKDSGEQFVSGIVDGLNSEIDDLAMTAADIASAFNEVFTAAMQVGLKDAFDTILEQLRAEFVALMNELKAQIATLQAQLESAQAGKDVQTGKAIMVEGVPVYEGSSSIGPGNIGELPQSEQDFIRENFPELFGNTAAMNSGNNRGGTTINVNVNTNNRAGGVAAAEEVVNSLKTWKTA